MFNDHVYYGGGILLKVTRLQPSMPIHKVVEVIKFAQHSGSEKYCGSLGFLVVTEPEKLY